MIASIKTTKGSDKSVSIVIPAYNEEATVAKVVSVARKLSYVTEVIVVDDGSTDRTVEEAESAGATVISHIMNEGKGSAIKTGFKNSHGNIVAFIDADISNFTSEKIDKIIRPILEDQTDITKTKFARESGRVTELTAKPLLGFFFPELNYEQPLSGQFAGKRSALNKIRFEKDYGVDVGIVLDADVHGIKILEVDIGDISHDMSPLADLNKMANEVVRTIIDVAFIGVVLTVFYFLRIIRRSIPILKKSNTRASLQSFVRMHFPLIVAGLILILMLSTFLSAASFDDGKISVELTSRNFVYAPSDHNQQTISVRGPYTIDSALENETDILRVPADALSTLEMTENDTMIIDGKSYFINGTKEGDSGDRFRLPSRVKRGLDLSDGEVIPNSRLTEVFQGITVKHNIQFNNLSDVMEGFVEFDISPKSTNATFFNLTLDNESILSSVGNFENDSSYSISYDGKIMCTFDYDDVKNGNLTFTFDGKEGMVEFENRNSTSIRNYVSSDRDSFVQLRSL